MRIKNGPSLSYPLSPSVSVSSYEIMQYLPSCITLMEYSAWMNNCVGHLNHRYFYTFMAWMCIGVIFLIIFGVEILYAELFLISSQEEDYEEMELEGHPVRINNSGAIIPVVCIPLTSQ